MQVKHAPLLLLLFILMKSGLSQTTVAYKDFKWEPKPTAFTPDANDTISQIVIEDKVAYQIAVENNISYEYYFRHTKTFVKSDQAIERKNTIYLPSGISSEVVKLDVRVIKPTGEIIEMNNQDIKEAVDRESERKYKYLAVRGLERGCVIEEVFLTKTPSDFTGRILTVQSEYPIRNFSAEIIFPQYLVVDTRSYNGLPNFEKDTTYKKDGLACRKIASTSIAALKPEKYSNRVAAIQKIAYKLTGNNNSRNLNINSYDKISDVIFQKMNKPLSKAETKSLDKIFSNASISYAKNEEDKIRKLEDYVKKVIYSSEDLPNYSVSIDKMLETKIADEASLTKLFVAAFNSLDIEYQILISCNHYDLIFENDFEGLNYLDKFFIYFPKYNKYLAPAHILYRYGFMPYQFRNQYGLFIKKMSLGNLTTGLGEVRFVEPDTYLENCDSLIINADFSKGLDAVKYKYRITNSGHEAAGLQSLMDYINDEKKKDEIRREIVKNFADEAEIEDLKVENEGAEYFAKKPYVINASFTSEKYIDKAGGKYIFKVGELIGPQEQLYQEEARKLPIDMNYCKNYFRIITFKIPAGYKLSNSEKLNMDINHKDKDGEQIMAFRSWFDIKGEQVTVYAEEYYKKINLPVKDYEPFKAVINASADFNKIVLLFEPK
jgi:hypothetical protein